MANITLTSLYSSLPAWAGLLMQAQSDTTITANTATQFTYRLGASAGALQGYKVEVTGTGFTYHSGQPIDGTMTGVRILNGAGATVLTLSSLGSNAFVNDLSQLYSSVFGNGTNGPGPQPEMAWSQLLAGNDVITGALTNDDNGLVGMDAGDDVYNMRSGDDYIVGGLGNDTINGGDGYDVLSFGESVYSLGLPAYRGATINAQAGLVIDIWGGRDEVTEVEEFRGSRFNDNFIGNNINRDRFMGLRGRDTIDGGSNSFNSDGTRNEDRRDEVRYDKDANFGGIRGIIVDLETSFANNSIRGTIRDGFGNVDTVIDIERVIGTRFADVFVGSRMNNNFTGGEGKDSYNGGDGWDVVAFGRGFVNGAAANGIRVNLSLTSGQVLNDGFGNVENAISIESIVGTQWADSVIGSAGDNEMYLADGRDTMTGGAGADYFVWENRAEFGDGDVITDFTATGATHDILAFNTPLISGMTTTLRLVNGTAATTAQATFVFNAATDTLYWDPDGTGAAAALAIVKLTNVAALSAANFELWT